MQCKYMMGEYILVSTPQTMTYEHYAFERAQKTDTGWVLMLSKFSVQGYAGGGELLEYPVQLNESIPFASNMRAYVKSAMKPDKAGKPKQVKSMQIVDVDKYSVTMFYELV